MSIKNKLIDVLDFSGKNIDSVFLQFTKKILNEIKNKTEMSDDDIQNLSLIIMDVKISLLDLDINSFLYEKGWTDKSGTFLSIPTGDGKKDLIIQKLNEKLKGGKMESSINAKIKDLSPWAFYRIKEMEKLAATSKTYSYNQADQNDCNFRNWSEGSFSGRFFDFQIALSVDNDLEERIEETRLQSSDTNSDCILFEIN